MPTFSIDTFKQSVVRRGGFSRGHLFDCEITSLGRKMFYPCRSTQLPAYTIESTPISYMSMSGNLPGKRTYEPMTLTFYNTHNYQLRIAFLDWQDNIRGLYNNQQDPNSQRYYDDVRLYHYDDSNRVRAVYTLRHAFPTSIGGLSFSQDNESEFQTFDVTLAYLFMKVEYGDVDDAKKITENPLTGLNGAANIAAPTPARTYRQQSYTEYRFDLNTSRAYINGKEVTLQEYGAAKEADAERFERIQRRNRALFK